MNNKKQKQKVSDGSTAIQAAGDIIITSTGLTYSEAREVALDVFRSNFYELAGMAKETAKARAEEITEAFLDKLRSEYPTGFEKSNNPDFQYALFTVQREYARSGDKELGDLLVDLLVDRSKQEQRDILQIVLNESLNIAPKLTENQLSALAMIFLFKHTQNFSIGNHIILGKYLDNHVHPFVSKLVKNLTCYRHLEFSGCGSVGIGSGGLEDIFGITYQGLFLKGFVEKEVTDRNISIGLDSRFFMQCLNDPSKLQIRATNQELLIKNFEQHNITPDDCKQMTLLFDMNKMSGVEIKNKCIQIRPYMADLFEIWSESAMSQFDLTSVGIAIGHANIKRLVGEFADLSIWIN
jgi:hypothetical protein